MRSQPVGHLSLAILSRFGPFPSKLDDLSGGKLQCGVCEVGEIPGETADTPVTQMRFEFRAVEVEVV